MKSLFLFLIAGCFLLSPLTHAGDDVDKSGPPLTPPAGTAPTSTFTKSDCDEKIAILKKKHQANLKKLRNQTKKLKERIESLQAENAKLKQLLAAAKPATASEHEPQPQEEETEESGNPAWFPWILALILAVVGFLIGRNSAGSDSSSN